MAPKKQPGLQIRNVVRQHYKTGKSQCEIAKSTGVSQSMLQSINNRLTKAGRIKTKM